jgi:hypothetical protein
MVGWMRVCAEWLEPLVKLLGQTVLASHLLQTDDLIEVELVSASHTSKCQAQR